MVVAQKESTISLLFSYPGSQFSAKPKSWNPVSSYKTHDQKCWNQPLVMNPGCTWCSFNSIWFEEVNNWTNNLCHHFEGNSMELKKTQNELKANEVKFLPSLTQPRNLKNIQISTTFEPKKLQNSIIPFWKRKHHVFSKFSCKFTEFREQKS